MYPAPGAYPPPPGAAYPPPPAAYPPTAYPAPQPGFAPPPQPGFAPPAQYGYPPQPMAPQQPVAMANSQQHAYALDAADGVIDGRSYGRPVAQVAPPAAGYYPQPGYPAPVVGGPTVIYAGKKAQKKQVREPRSCSFSF